MDDFVNALGQGLRSAAGILNPNIQAQNAQADLYQKQLMDQAFIRQNERAQNKSEESLKQIELGIRTGEIDPAAGNAQLKAMGYKGPDIAPSPHAQLETMSLKSQLQGQKNAGLQQSVLSDPTNHMGGDLNKPLTPEGQSAYLSANPELGAKKAESQFLPKAPIHIPAGSLVQQPDGTFKQEGSATAEESTAMKEIAALYGKDSPSYKRELARHVSKMDAPARTTINMAGGGGSSDMADPKQARFWAEQYLTNKTPPPIAWGAAGNADRALFRKAVSELAAEKNMNGGDMAANQAGFKSGASALTAITKDITTFEPYKKMLDKNGDIAIDLGKKVLLTNSALANKPLNWIKQNMGSNPDTAEYLFQINTLQTEASRVLSNPRLVGQLSDSARQEMQAVVNGSLPIPIAERVIRRMQKDGDNRFDAMKNQAETLRKGLGGNVVDVPPAPATGGKVINFGDLK
jgi:hypothetical protein